MTLIDTSVWIDHLRRPEELLAHLLRQDKVTMHPYVIGEIALGNFENRGAMLARLDTLPTAPVARHPEILQVIDEEKLFGTGLGYVDVHLLASARLMKGSDLWTRDKRLLRIAERMGLALQLN